MVTRNVIRRIWHAYRRIADLSPAATEACADCISDRQSERSRQFHRLRAVVKFAVLSAKAEWYTFDEVEFSPRTR